MKKPLIPVNEKARVKALHDLNILDTPIQPCFERITRLTQIIYRVPIVAFSLVDSERQWFKSIQGLDASETSREVSFCGHTINEDKALIVNDTAKDERFFDHPSVIGSPHIRCYVGYPVKAPNGEKIGSLCIVDTKPRNFSEGDLEPLRDMAALIESEIVANKLSFNQAELIKKLNTVTHTAHIDALTRLYNRGSLERLLEKRISHASHDAANFGIVMIDIDNFKSINDHYGHCTGDAVLREISKLLLSSYTTNETIGRWGGEEFLVISDVNTAQTLFARAEQARKVIAETPIKFEDQTINVTITAGISLFRGTQPCDLLKLVTEADKALYVGKRQTKNIVVTYGDNINENVLNLC